MPVPPLTLEDAAGRTVRGTMGQASIHEVIGTWSRWQEQQSAGAAPKVG
jgi:hypothetical protein